MPCGDLDVPQIHACIEHGRGERMAKYMRVRPGDPHTSIPGQVPQAARGRVAVHPGAAAVEQDRAVGAGADGAVDSPPDGRRERDEDDPGAFAAHAQHPVAVFFAEVGAGSFEDPQTEQPQHRH